MKGLLLPLLLALGLGGGALARTPPLERQLLHDAGVGGRLEWIRPRSETDDAPRLRLLRGARLVWEARARSFERLEPPLRVAPGAPPLIGVIGWSGGAYCCWTLHLFAQTPEGLIHAGDVALGKREPGRLPLQRPGESLLRIPDAAFDFWDYLGSLGADIGPPVPHGWDGRRVAPQPAAMRNPPDIAIGPACAPIGDEAAPPAGLPSGAGLAAAVARLRDDPGWAAPFAPGGAHPATEAARLILCLVYAGQAAAAPMILAAFPPAQAALRAATEQQLRARLACSPYAPLLRRLNPQSPLIPGACRREGPDHTAVATALERR